MLQGKGGGKEISQKKLSFILLILQFSSLPATTILANYTEGWMYTGYTVQWELSEILGQTALAGFCRAVKTCLTKK